MKGQKKAFACLAVLGTALLLCGAAWAGRQKETSSGIRNDYRK